MDGGSSSSRPERVVLLVTTPLNASINAVLATFGSKVARLTPALSDWPQVSPPPVTENFCFARHMAVCLIPLGVWENNDVSFPAKFAAGSFWEHRGSASIGSASKHPGAGRKDGGRTWTSEDIESIEAVQRLGTTHMSDSEIYEQLFTWLFHDWVYLPIWWNCQDFAARLGYLLGPTVNSLQVLKSLLCRLKESMMREVIGKRDFLLMHVPALGWFVSLPLSLFCLALDRSRKRLSVSYMKNLESRFPNLRELHGRELFEVLL
ncbi:hypothetical protein RB595_007256 [Gaeumannomyces hyphopodioides]